MPTKQVQIRGGSDAVMLDSLLAPREIGVNTTKKRLHLGDGITPGGAQLPNIFDIQSNALFRCDVGGTANALTLTTPLSLTDLTEGMEFKFVADITCTGPVTAVVDGINPLSPIEFRKKTFSGLAALENGDLIQDGAYTAYYDGTYLQLTGTNEPNGLVLVSQGDIKTSVGSGTVISSIATTYAIDVTLYSAALITSMSGSAASFIGAIATPPVSGVIRGGVGLPGGTYGFMPQVYLVLNFSLRNVAFIQRFVTSSPPFDLGDGDVQGFIYALVDPSGAIRSHWASEVPPWAYNGPTDIRCTHQCPVTKKKFRTVREQRTLEEIMDGAKAVYKPEEITHSVKNADMAIIPHPFVDVPDGWKVVLMDPMDERIGRLIAVQNEGEDIGTFLQSERMRVDSEQLCRRKGPDGIPIHRMKFKYGG